MNIQQGNSKTVGPIGTVIFGIALLAIDCFFFWRAITGVKAGKIGTIGRGIRTLVVSQDKPGEFWVWVVCHCLLVILTLWIAFLVFRIAFRQLRK